MKEEKQIIVQKPKNEIKQMFLVTKFKKTKFEAQQYNLIRFVFLFYSFFVMIVFYFSRDKNSKTNDKHDLNIHK